ncbi:lysophospholipid acyltransferase family protein [Thermocrispum sp.]|uniref:lysophospholipid acyltransferase family protein n=1 Tax=Thermocrispum sp. TaxID=2060768 RepID=UPI00257CDEBA|nr:lysophospholipid acyltransferase family protein [Thermocrispum sp.]
MPKERPVPTSSLPQAHPWMPTSPCGPDCVEAETPPSAGRLRVILRLASALLVLLLAGIASPLLFLMPRRVRPVVVRTLFGAMLRAFGARLVVHGRSRLVRAAAEPQRGVMTVNNHISWLDIVALNSVQPMRALAKSELRSWPVLGGLIRRAGTVFVNRESLRSLPGTVAELAEAFRGGAMVNVAGEGTTWCGKASGRYVPAPFQAAIDGGAAVLPVALRYRLTTGEQTTAPAFVGTESLVASLMRVARLRGLVIEMFVCQEIPAGRTADRRELADLTESAVLSALGMTAALGSRPWQPRILQPEAERIHRVSAGRSDSAA